MPKIISTFEKWIKGFFPKKAVPVGPMSLDGMIFGLPPSTHISDTMIWNSMPKATIIPCEPVFSSGASLFTLDQSKGWEKYQEILQSVGFTMGNSNKVTVSYIVDSFPTDTFNNEYGETIFDRMASGVSTTVGDFSQILGLTNTKDLKNLVGSMPGGGAANKVGGKISDMYNGFIDNLEENGNTNGASLAKTVGSSLAAAATGSRIDFPQVWKNSSFTPSYTMTIRLYNPDPGNPYSTKRYIVGPIAALLALALPKVGNEDVASYKWPLFCKVISPGIYNLNSSFISNISIIKGGDQQNIAYNQSLAMCDVRIEFGSLYNSMIAGKGSNKYSDKRPTLGNYLEVLGGKKFSGKESFVHTENAKYTFKGNRSPLNLYDSSKRVVSIEEDDDTIGERIGNGVVATEKALAAASGSFIEGADTYAEDYSSDDDLDFI